MEVMEYIAMTDNLRTIQDIDLTGKRVFLRTGWDVPLDKVKSQKSKVKIEVVDDIRIRESLPTLKYLIEHDVRSITIGFHLDRPEGKMVPELSVRPVIERLTEILSEMTTRQITNDKLQMSTQTQMTNGQNNSPFGNSDLISHSDFRFRHLIEKPLDRFEIIGALVPITIYDNLRFDPREEANDESFAKELAQGQDLYINDAFSDSHRCHASMVAITKFLPAYAGFLVEDELRHLSILTHKPARPFVVIIGGAKIEDKMPVIDAFAKEADTVLVGGKTGLEYEKKVKSQKSKVKSNIFPPIDDADGFDIGPETLERFVDKIKTAKTIFWNGNMGKSEEERYARGTKTIAQAISLSQATIKIAGGGDTTAFIHQARLTDQFTFLSSGGGATLDYLAGQELPGLDALGAN